MLNPFKKKDSMNSFKLDEEKLPSLSENSGSSAPQNNNPSEDYGMPNFDNMKTEQNFSNPVGTNPTGASFSNPFMQNSQQQQQIPQQDNSSLHNDLTKAKLDTIEGKISLIDSRISNMENKIDMIYQLIVSEVSQETKAKLNINNAMDRLRRNN